MSCNQISCHCRRTHDRPSNHDVQLNRLGGPLQVDLFFDFKAEFGIDLRVDAVAAFEVAVPVFSVGLCKWESCQFFLVIHLGDEEVEIEFGARIAGA